jgi:hypothetical protein
MRSMLPATRIPSTPTPAAKFDRRERLRIIMKQAWAWARHGAQKFGGSPRLYLAEALRMIAAAIERGAHLKRTGPAADG